MAFRKERRQIDKLNAKHSFMGKNRNSALYSNCNEKTRESFKQVNNMVHFTFWKKDHLCCHMENEL